MKKIINNIKTLAALLIASATFVACSSDDNIIDQQPAQPAGQQVYTMTVNALKGGDAPTTRALSPDGSTLNATWTEGDEVKVYNSSSTEIGTLTAQTAGANTTLNGTLTTLPSNSETLTLKYLSPNYSSQDGTLTGSNTSIDKVCDYATAEVTVSSISGSNITTTDASFQNQQAIVKFTLIDKADGTTTLSASQLVINDGTTDYTITPASATSEIYVAIPGISEKTVTLTATVGSGIYTYEKTGVTFTNGKFYRVTVKMTKVQGVLSGQFSVGSGTKVYFSKGNLQYTKSTGKWSFMTNQYSTVETLNQSVGTNYASQNVVSLFGWGTSGSAPSGQTARDSYYTNANNDDYVSNITTTGESWGTGSEWDWGTAAASDLGSGWRTLTKDEWVYLFNTRTVNNGQGSGKSYTLGQTVNDVLGVVLYPDDYTGSTYSGSDWSTFESAGCVFLPAAGYRSGPSVYDVGSLGAYWSSTASSASNAYYVRFISGTVNPANNRSRYSGYSVRLVRPVE